MPADDVKATTRWELAGGGVSERWLCALWHTQRWRESNPGGRTLATADGRQVQVVYAGRHTCDHGPDFRDALLVIDDELVRGDVELHVRSGDWRGHGHHSDAYYDRVVLHVVWRDDGSVATTTAGRQLPVVALAQCARGYAGDDMRNLVEEESLGQSMPCFLGNTTRSPSELRGRLTTMGETRLAEKSAAFEAALAVEQPAQVLYAALLDALGYASNRGPCRELAQLIRWQVVAAVGCGLPMAARIAELEALFLGAAGLLLTERAVARQLAPDDAVYAAGLEGRWSALCSFWGLTPLPRQAWRFARVRPENFPPRRLVAAARLFAPYVDADLPGVFLGVVRSEQPEDIAAALEAVLTVPADGYWASHHDFGCKPALPSQLIGRARAADIAVNVVLPFAIAMGEARSDRTLADRALGALRGYPPLAENELTRYVSRLIFGRARPKGMLACQQQGLLLAYHRYCQQKLCGECPLAADG